MYLPLKEPTPAAAAAAPKPIDMSCRARLLFAGTPSAPLYWPPY